MGLASIEVAGVYKEADDTLLRGKRITFVPLNVFGDDGDIIPRSPVVITSDSTTAAFSTTLLTSDLPDAYVRYQVHFHTGDKRKFDLTDDDLTVSLEDLINLYDGTQSPSGSVALAALEARVADIEDNPEFVGLAYADSLKALDTDYIPGGTSPLIVSSSDTLTPADSWFNSLFVATLAPTGDADTYASRYASLEISGSSTNATVYGDLLLVRPRNNSNAIANLYGSLVSVNLDGTASAAIGLQANAFKGNSNGSPSIKGIVGIAGGGYNTTDTVTGGEFEVLTAGTTPGTVTNARGLKSWLNNRIGNVITDHRGLSLDGWVNDGTVTASYGIYADTSIDVGATKYFIYSLSASDSLFTGPVRGPINAYNAGTWNGSNKFATEDAVRDKIETLILGAGGINGTGTATLAAYFTGTSEIASMPLKWNGSEFRWFKTDVDTDDWQMVLSPAASGGFGIFQLGDVAGVVDNIYIQPAYAQISFDNVVLGLPAGSGNGTNLDISDSTQLFKFNGAAMVELGTNAKFRIVTAQTPASAGADGSAGQIAWDANYIYVCTATNTWKRVAIATW